MPPTSGYAYPVTQPKSNKGMVIAITLLGIAVVALSGVIFSRMLAQPAQKDSGKVVQAPAHSGPGNVVQAPAGTKPSQPVQAPGGTPPPPPVEKIDVAAIDDYLRFLKKVEDEKQGIIRKQMADQLALLVQVKSLSATIEGEDYNNAFDNAHKTMDTNTNEWDKLAQYFNTKSPPPACVELRNKYYDHLGKVSAAIFKVNNAMSQIRSNPSNALSELTQMQGKTSGEVDAAIQSADDALYDVCKQFNLRKEFDIRGDAPTASMFR